MRECTSRGDECGQCFPSGKCGTKFGALGVTPRQLRRVQESRLSWRLKRAVPSFGTVRCNSKVLEATPVPPRRVRESRLLWCRMRAAPLSGGSVANPVCWRQLQYDPLMCGHHACRGAWMDTALSRECGANLETLEFAPVLPRMRESNDCACRGLDVCCNFFGGCRMTPKHWTHLRAATPRANQPSQRQYADYISLGRCGAGTA